MAEFLQILSPWLRRLFRGYQRPRGGPPDLCESGCSRRRRSDLCRTLALRDTCFDRVDFSSADLAHAVFDDVSLVGCDFRGARLTLATFRSCDLRDALFDRATLLRGSRFDGSNLIAARGLSAAGARAGPQNRGHLPSLGPRLRSGATFSVCRALPIRHTSRSHAEIALSGLWASLLDGGPQRRWPGRENSRRGGLRGRGGRDRAGGAGGSRTERRGRWSSWPRPSERPRSSR